MHLKSYIGLLAGAGELPLVFIQEVKKRGKKVVVTGIKNVTSNELEKFVSEINWVELNDVDKCLDFFCQKRISELIILGKFDKALMFKYEDKFESFKKLLFRLPDTQDLSFFKYFLSQEAEKRGLNIVSPSIYLSDLLVKEDELINCSVEKKGLEDVRYGWQVAKKLASMDIGQTVVIKNLTVLAVEAIEGTDRTILRGGALGGEGTVVVKVARPKQDMRFDIPVVGPKTLINMARVKSKLLAIEKEKVFLLYKSDVLSIARENQISILGIGG